MCKKGEHLKVAEEIKSIKLPKMNVTCEDGENEMELQENGVRNNHCILNPGFHMML